MECKNSWISVNKPMVKNDISVLSRQWGNKVDIKIEKPFKITKGPIMIKYL